MSVSAGKVGLLLALFMSQTLISSGLSQMLVRASTGRVAAPPEFYEKLAIGMSTNGIDWQWLYTKPTLTNFSRDASLIRYQSDFVTVFTSAFNSTNATFGLARSSDLVNWTATNVALTGAAMTNTPNNTWAPEWFVEDGRYYVLVRSSQTSGNNYGEPGIGYIECRDPGTWTDWTDFTVLPGPRSNENDPFLIKVGSTYHLFTDDGGTGTGKILHRTSTNSAFAGYGEPTVIGTDFRQAAALTNSTAWWQATPFEGQFVLPLGGDNYRLYFQATWWDNCFAIDSTNGMQSWNLDSMRELTYDGMPARGHGSIVVADEAIALLPLAALAKRADYAIAETQTIRTNPNAFNLYSALQYEANRIAGRADVTGTPSSYGLYTAASIADLNLGGVVLAKDGSNAMVHLQIQSTTNLAEAFTNHPANVSFPVDLPGDKYFLRVRALGPQ